MPLMFFLLKIHGILCILKRMWWLLVQENTEWWMMPVLHEGGLEQEVAEATQRTRPRTITNLGHLVKDMKIKSVEICLFSWPIKDFEIIAFFFLILESMPVSSRPMLARQPGSRHLPSLDFTMDMLVWVLSAPKRWPLPSMGPSPWSRAPSSTRGEVTRGTRSASSTLSQAR